MIAILDSKVFKFTAIERPLNIKLKMKHLSYLFLILTISCSSLDYVEMKREALEKFYNEEHQEAIALLEKIIKNDPQDTSYILLMGKCYLAIEQDLKAIEFINRSIELDDNYTDAYATRAIYYSNVPDYENSFKDIRKAIALSPRNSRNYFIKSSIEKEANLIDSAIITLTTLAELTSKNAEVFNQRAYLYMSKKNYNLALIDLNKATELGSTGFPTIVNRGFVQIQLENYNEAKNDFINAKELTEDGIQLSIVLNNLGYSEMLLGNLEEAKRNINEAIRLNDQNSYAYKNLAKLQITFGNIDAACEALNNSLDRGFTELYGDEVANMKMEYCKK